MRKKYFMALFHMQSSSLKRWNGGWIDLHEKGRQLLRLLTENFGGFSLSNMRICCFLVFYITVNVIDQALDGRQSLSYNLSFFGFFFDSLYRSLSLSELWLLVGQNKTAERVALWHWKIWVIFYPIIKRIITWCQFWSFISSGSKVLPIKVKIRV